MFLFLYKGGEQCCESIHACLETSNEQVRTETSQIGKFFEVLKLPVWLAIFCALYSFSCAKAIRDEAANWNCLFRFSLWVRFNGDFRQSFKISFISVYLQWYFIEFFSKYSLKNIVNVEENHDVLKGDRYLIDLVSQCFI